MGMSLLSLPDELIHRRTSFLFDDFNSYTDTQLWTKLAADSGSSVANSDGDFGILTLTTGATNNNEAMVRSTRKLYTIGSTGKVLLAEARINYAEAATNAANVAIGFSSAAAANLLVDDGAGPATSMSGCLIFKVDGGTVWKVVSSISTTQTISTSTTTAGGTNDQVLSVQIQPISTTVAEATFYVNGQQLVDSTTLRPIKHTFTYTGAAAMYACAYVKDGSGTGEVLSVDYIGTCSLRKAAGDHGL